MSRFMSDEHSALVPYVPGEQPRTLERIIKLNTNENPYPPSPRSVEAACSAARRLQLYSDPQSLLLRQKLAEYYHVGENNVMCCNSSDEVLDLCFLTFCDGRRPAAFADITYGFYRVYCDLYHIPYTEIPLQEDFTLDLSDYTGIEKNIFIANPNAPTGIALSRDEIERIIASNPDNIVVIDEAYVDFGGESCIPLTEKYDNLIVCMTYSKSRSMAGARLGFAIANESLIADLNTVRYSRSPYNVNLMTAAAGIGALEDDEYRLDNIRRIVETRDYMTASLEKMGFTVLKSSANFIFVRSDRIGGAELYRRLKEWNIFVRHFETPRLKDFNRITAGTMEQTEALLRAVKEILEEMK